MKYIQFTKNNIQEVKGFIITYFDEIDEEVYLWITESSRDGVNQIDFKYQNRLLQLQLNNYVVVNNGNIEVMTELKFEEINNKTNYNFSKYYNELKDYYFISHHGAIVKKEWDYHYTDKEKYNNRNCFKNKETAEKFAKIQLLQRKLLQFSLENGMDEIDWDNKDTKKYYIYYHSSGKYYYINWYYCSNELGTVYFKDKETAKKALELFKNDLEEIRNIKW